MGSFVDPPPPAFATRVHSWHSPPVVVCLSVCPCVHVSVCPFVRQGYVDWSDYEAIYADGESRGRFDAAALRRSLAGGARGGDGEGEGLLRTSRDGASLAPAGAPGSTVAGARRAGGLRGSAPPASREPLDSERVALLKRAFDRYDVDGDGAISVDDLKLAFEAQGRPVSDPYELIAWVRRRDATGVGLYVSFDDFVAHYQ